MTLIMTVDVEDWYHTNGLDLPSATWGNYEDRVVANTMKVLELLSEHRIPATFFVLGCVAEKHPGLVREIVKSGHELGSHGGWHRMANRMTREEFRQDVRWSKSVIEQAAGAPVKYYRAPSWSIPQGGYEALLTLEEEGFICDSSLQPFRTPLSGSATVPVQPFRPILNGRSMQLVELPPSVWNIGPVRIPFSGGFYLRFWPSWFTRMAFRQIERARIGTVYVHPWEFDPSFPRLHVPWLIRFIQYYGLASTADKLSRLYRQFTFIPLRQYLESASIPELVLPTSDKHV